MAPKRPANKPTVSSSDKSSSSEEEQEQKTTTKTSPSPDRLASKKPSKRTHPPESDAASPTRSAKRRPPPASESGAGKSSKSEDETEKKLLFQRLWSDEDEIAILEGMISFAAKRGSYPSDMAELHGFIKKSLGIEASTSQLKDKVRRLQKKHANNAARKKFNPSKPHDKRVFELSEKIWGGGAEEEREIGVENVGPSWVGLRGIFGSDKGLLENVLKLGVEGLIPKEKAAEIEAKWRKIEVSELELYVKRSELVCEQMKLVLKALKSSDQ